MSDPVSRIPSPETTLREMLTDRKAIFDSAFAPIVFVAVDSFVNLKAAAIAAASLGIATAVFRLVRRQKVTYAVSGLFGLGLAIALALRSGRSSDFFLPSVIFGGIYGVLAIVSAAVGRPVSSYLAKVIEQRPADHYTHGKVKRAHMLITIVWGAFFLARAGFRWFLIQRGSTGALAASALFLGYPATALLIAGTYAYLKLKLGPLRRQSDESSASEEDTSSTEPSV